MQCYVIAVFLASAVPLFVLSRPFLRPSLQLQRCCAQGLSRLAALRPPGGLGLDGFEPGATPMQVETLWRASSRIRMRAPC
jgi:hypothetical protein